MAAAFVAHDLGYDVWLGNSRGSSFSRAHANFDVNSEAFWNFSFTEIGLFDVPV